MKWRPLTAAGHDLAQQLFAHLQAPSGRPQKVLESLRTLEGLGEIAAIPLMTGFLVNEDRQVAQAAVRIVGELLARTPNELLPALDERMRSHRAWMGPPQRWLSALGRFSSLWNRVKLPSWAASLASSHWDGHVREAAVKNMSRQTENEAFVPFLLLRLDDWVRPVRYSAEMAVAKWLHASHRGVMLRNLTIIARLKGRMRAGQSSIMARIEDFLRAETMPLLETAIRTAGGAGGRYGLSLALDSLPAADDSRQAAVLERMAGTDDPAVRLRLMKWLTGLASSPAARNQFLAPLLRDRFVAVRRAALLWHAEHEPHTALAALRTALLDRSHAIREIAQFYLPRIEPTDVRGFYLAVIAQGNPRLLKAAIGGLGATGRPEDSTVLVPLVDSPAKDAGEAAISALARLAPERHVELFVRVLQSDSPRLSREARNALAPQAKELGAELVATIFAEARWPHVRVQTLRLISALPPWQGLALLLPIVGSGAGELQELAEAQLSACLGKIDYRYAITPGQGDVSRVEALLAGGLSLKINLSRRVHRLVKVYRQV